ncbi:metal ABC transporter ATP-binding protein [Salsipaludibacter albus]|uniref:metal ABC transporter ATP-binding protein n=1 Tax=Salsipaludibacter albus TaxID=2849650 RepID=UPI001EE3E99B|nr:metal ABC transporter ATP-binding protein [Salsipaludibacter albus]MBY5161161.1 metal ABC transporter ATP-binding protein [Salsipaludibacter albus]
MATRTAPTPPDDTTGDVAARAVDLAVDYGSRHALAAATFNIPRGSRTAVIGPNGSGKTTLLRVLGNLVRPSRGQVDVLGAPQGDARRSVAHVLQATHINPGLPLTVREVVTMGRYPHVGLVRRFRDEDRDAVDRAMERMQVAELAGRQVVELSGGQRQRVSVAQGLAQEADLLLLDEPVTGLDAPSLQRIEAVVQEEADAGRTVVMTTHDIAEAARADHVVLLATRLVATGVPDVVLTQENLAAAYGAMTFTTADGTVVIGDPHVHGGVHTHE